MIIYYCEANHLFRDDDYEVTLRKQRKVDEHVCPNPPMIPVGWSADRIWWACEEHALQLMHPNNTHHDDRFKENISDALEAYYQYTARLAKEKRHKELSAFVSGDTSTAGHTTTGGTINA